MYMHITKAGKNSNMRTVSNIKARSIHERSDTGTEVCVQRGREKLCFHLGFSFLKFAVKKALPDPARRFVSINLTDPI